MDKYGTNGHSVELSQYETPFADIAFSREDVQQHEPVDKYFSSFLQEIETPFSKTYETTYAPSGPNPAGEEFVNFLGELNNADFENTLYELAADMESSWSSKISSETALGNNFIPFATQQARQYAAPLIRQAEEIVDAVAEHFSGNDMAAHSEADIESYFSELTYDSTAFSPAQDQFLGGLVNKVKSVVKKGVALAKKGISAVSKLMPINLVLKKIKGLVKPLLEKVLKMAIGKLPKNLQPHAQTLAKKFLKLESPEESTFTSESTGGDVAAIQTELDTHIAQLVFSDGEQQSEELISDYVMSFENMERTDAYENAQPDVPSLGEARVRFINELKNLQPGESPAPAIENFLPAAIIALQPVIKIAISIIGRQKVINFLAGLLAKLVSKYVPENIAKPLAASIIDVGMSAIGFETVEMQKPDLAYEAIANTIQDTVHEMNSLDEASLSDQETLTMHLLEAFEKAAVKNFPPQYIRPDLRATRQQGLWIQMPRSGGAQSYKKFSNVYNITIDPATATGVTTFRNLPLANFLRDKLGLDPSKPIQARVHVYEATKETKLTTISRTENLPGLNSKQPFGWVQLHPLTSKAASDLLKEPAMGKDVPPQFQVVRSRITAGQRFYYLEINGARLRIPQADPRKRKTPRPSQSGDVQAVINFTKAEIRLNYYFSEEDAKSVVEKLNRNDAIGSAVVIRNSIRNVLNGILLKNVTNKVKIIHEAFPELYLENYDDRQQQFAPLAAVGKELIGKIVEKLVEKLTEQAYQALVNYFKARAAEFKEAQAQPQDGVTVKIIWTNVQGMTTIKTVINAIKGKLSVGNLADLTLPSLSIPDIQIAPDKKFD